MKIKIFLLAVISGLLFSCNENKSTKKLDTITSGLIYISVDESLKPLVEAQIQVFEALYPSAHIVPKYVSEVQAFNDLLNDSASMIIVSRKLTKEEDAYLLKQQHKAKTNPIAYDGIGFILNLENTDSVFTTSDIAQILSGELIGTNSKFKDMNVVFDNASSGAIRYLNDSLLKGKKLGKNCFAVNSNPEVIKYVKENKNTIGVIGSAWISDSEDSSSIGFLKDIRLASLVPYDTINAYRKTMQPYQAFIGLRQYPFWREISAISREPRVGLATGFIGFIKNDRGQRIILKSGIVPANAPIRYINTKPKK